MTISVKYFAMFREAMGSSSEEVELSDLSEPTMLGIWNHVVAKAPKFDGRQSFVRFAQNQEFVSIEQTLSDGDEVAIIPPVSGGAGKPRFCVTDGELNIEQVVATVRRPEAGAVITFEGVVRNKTADRSVDHLEYEVYYDMALAKLRQVADEVETQFGDVEVAIHHRFGRLEIGEVSVVIAVSSPHRKDAFAACEATIDRLKEEVPIWKKEVSPDGDEWVAWGS